MALNFSKNLQKICIKEFILALLTIYKSFIRPHLDCGDVIYDQPNNESLCQTLESVQYKAALA